jgi:hypothetical protein
MCRMPKSVLSSESLVIPNASGWLKSFEINPNLLIDDMVQNILANHLADVLGVALGLHQDHKYEVMRRLEDVLIHSPDLALGFLKHTDLLIMVAYETLINRPPTLTQPLTPLNRHTTQRPHVTTWNRVFQLSTHIQPLIQPLIHHRYVNQHDVN